MWISGPAAAVNLSGLLAAIAASSGQHLRISLIWRLVALAELQVRDCWRSHFPRVCFRCLIIPSHITRLVWEESNSCLRESLMWKCCLAVWPPFTQFCCICHDLTQTGTNQNEANYFKLYLMHLWTYLEEPGLAFRVLDESCSLFDSSCLLHSHATMPNISFPISISVSCKPCWERLKSLWFCRPPKTLSDLGSSLS